jgi:hypothetical protein
MRGSTAHLLLDVHSLSRKPSVMWLPRPACFTAVATSWPAKCDTAAGSALAAPQKPSTSALAESLVDGRLPGSHHLAAALSLVAVYRGPEGVGKGIGR